MKKSVLRFMAAFMLLTFGMCTVSCAKKEPEPEVPALTPEEQKVSDAVAAFTAISHPAEYAAELAVIAAAIDADKLGFYNEIEAVIAADTDNFLVLIDRNHIFPENYQPEGMVTLVKNNSYPVNKSGMQLKASVEEVLRTMADAAKADGQTLLVSSAFRTYDYQKMLYERYIREMGKEAADRVSAPPGTSQHHLGTAIDFGSISEDYADTPPGKWLTAHAAEYGFSLSFPQGYEPVTGYMWECWHYRYIGTEAVAMQQKWFNDIQQYMLEFIDCYKSL